MCYACDQVGQKSSIGAMVKLWLREVASGFLLLRVLRVHHLTIVDQGLTVEIQNRCSAVVTRYKKEMLLLRHGRGGSLTPQGFCNNRPWFDANWRAYGKPEEPERLNSNKETIMTLAYRILIVVICAAGAFLPVASVQADPKPRPVPVIFDTDMSGDCDDAGSLSILNSFMNQDEATILACVVNGRDQDSSSGATVYAINTFYGRPHIPIGAYHGEATATKSSYTLKVRQQFVPDYPTDAQLPPAVEVYRRALLRAKRHSVVIVSVGFMQNLRDLLQSKPDKISKLDGVDLVKARVKELVVMGGSFPTSGNGTEYNFGFGGVGPATAYTMQNWPGRILFTGFEIGAGITTGRSLALTPAENPVRFIYSLYGEHPSALEGGRPSWDLTAAWLAVRGPVGVWDLVEGGYCQVLPDGRDEWMTDQSKDQAYIKVKLPPAEVAKLIEAEMIRLPTRR